MKKIILFAASSLLSLPIYANVLANTTAYGRLTQVGDTIEVSSLHDVYIYNESPIMKLYTMKYLLCPQDKSCKVFDEYVYINPQGTFRKQTRLKVTVNYGASDNYALNAETTVYANNVLESDTYGKALVQVHR